MSNFDNTVNSSNTSYRRMFFVGLGGSGGKTLRFLKRDLNAWLKSTGWREGLPQGWQFLQIDTPTEQDGREITTAPMLETDEYIGLVSKGMDMETLDKSLFPPQSPHRTAGMSWRVVPESLNVNIQTGAGQYRAVGRSVALAFMQQMRTGLKNTYEKLNQPEAQSSLSRLYLHITGNNPSAGGAAPIVVIVSSLAGGTGAGLINDVCDLLREIDPDAGESFGILYTPDVFSELSNDHNNKAGGIQPNSLAAISEILNGYWWHGGGGGTDITIPTKKSTIMTQAGAIGEIKRTGPAYPFLVGRKNSAGISYRTSEQLFEIVGAALTSWVTDETVQDKLLSYSQANWRQAALKLKVSSHALVNKGNNALNEFGLNAFNALGFARVSLGNRYFRNYASERIGRDVVEFLASNFETGGAAQNLRAQHPQITAQELIERQADIYVDSFMQACKLTPLVNNDLAEYPYGGEPANDVEKALRPAEMSEFYTQALDSLLSAVNQEGKLTPDDWMRLITPRIEDAVIQFHLKCAAPLEENLISWVENQPTLVVEQVLALIGEVGIQIAEEVLGKVIQKLNAPFEGVTAQLKERANEDAALVPQETWASHARAVFQGKNKKIAYGQLVQSACSAGLTSAIYKTGVEIKQMTIDLLEQFVVGFLQPLQQTLKSTSLTLGDAKKLVSDWSSWPTNGSRGVISDSSRPPMSEYTVIKPDIFPSLFDELLSQTIPAQPGEDELRRHKVRSAVIRGEFLKDVGANDPRDVERLNRLQAIRITNPWWPNISQYLTAPRVVNQVSFASGFGVETVRERSEEWLGLENTHFKRVLDSSLRSYLDPQDVRNIGVSVQEFQERQGQFISAFQSAISASRPLVDLDMQLLPVLYPSQSHPQLEVEVSSLPFEGHDLQASLSQELVRLKGTQNVDNYFKSDNQINHIDFTTRLSGAYPILAISSLLMPIAQAWRSLKEEDRADFWDKRRARPLNEFIPAPQEHIICMLRGWFLGQKLGLITPSTNGGTYSVAPRGKEPGFRNTELPSRFLSASSRWGDAPAVVLESLGLAYVDVGAENNLEPLAGYINMLELGRAADAGLNDMLTDYDRIGDFVERWIETGQITLDSGFTPRANPNFDSSLIGGTPSDRRRALREFYEEEKSKYIDELAEYESKISTNATALALPPYWPSMHWLIDTALSQLIIALKDPA